MALFSALRFTTYVHVTHEVQSLTVETWNWGQSNGVWQSMCYSQYAFAAYIRRVLFFPFIWESSCPCLRWDSHKPSSKPQSTISRGLHKPWASFLCCLYKQFTSYVSPGLCKPCLVFPRINGPNVLLILTLTILQWGSNKAKLMQQGSVVMDAIKEHTGNMSKGSSSMPGAECVDKLFTDMCSNFDNEMGGIGGAPKFPQAGTVLQWFWKWFVPSSVRGHVVIQIKRRLQIGGTI